MAFAWQGDGPQHAAKSGGNPSGSMYVPGKMRHQKGVTLRLLVVAPERVRGCVFRDEFLPLSSEPLRLIGESGMMSVYRESQ